MVILATVLVLGGLWRLVRLIRLFRGHPVQGRR